MGNLLTVAALASASAGRPRERSDDTPQLSFRLPSLTPPELKEVRGEGRQMGGDALLGRTAQESVNDPMVGRQYDLDMIDIGDAWLTVTARDPQDVIVALIDCGVDTTHPELENMLWDDGKGNAGWNFEDDNNDVSDATGHGTMMAGIVGAQLNNSYGMAGVAGFTGKVKLMILKAGDSTGIDDAAVKRSLYYAADHHANVALMAFGNHEDDADLLDGMVYASSKNVFLVSSAGNAGKMQKLYPCAFKLNGDGTICVASTEEHTKELRGNSNWGDHVDVAAPGTSIWTTATDGFAYAFDTSPASAIVAGVAALLVLLGVEPQAIRSTIMDNTDELVDIDRPIKGGFVNAKKAAKAAVGGR